jgi:hypothetical protein
MPCVFSSLSEESAANFTAFFLGRSGVDPAGTENGGEKKLIQNIAIRIYLIILFYGGKGTWKSFK